MSFAAKALADSMIMESRRRLGGECLPRILKCLGHLSEEEIWHRPNAETVSVGNLVLHLCGNVRQYIISAIGQQPDLRRRGDEFDERGPIATGELIQRIAETVREAEAVIGRMTPDDFLGVYRVQGAEETGMSIVLHVVEHFSYHTGQITYSVKSRKGVDMGYYAGVDLNVTG